MADKEKFDEEKIVAIVTAAQDEENRVETQICGDEKQTLILSTALYLSSCDRCGFSKEDACGMIAQAWDSVKYEENNEDATD